MSSQSFKGNQASAAARSENTNHEYIGTIMYLAYGKSQYVYEAIFSLLTAAYFEPFDTGRIRYVVYTDQPEVFATLEGVILVRINKTKLEEWLDGSDYVHRRKLMAIVEALKTYKGKLAFIDTDTYFKRSPMRIFDRIGAGRSCLHLLEHLLCLSRSSDARKIRDSFKRYPFTWSDGSKASLGGDSEMWNSGVIGFDYSDIGVLREGLRLSDHLWEYSQVNTCEQFSIGVAARQMTSVSLTWDVVFHYWPKFLKQPFRVKLEKDLPEILALPAHLRPQAAFRARLKATPLQWLKLLKQPTKYAVARIGRSAYGILQHLRLIGRNC
ncbi:hypothetical protein [Paracoccus actinidiae]|uniref:hypothetical protein n=1 Tax=Paracoccus actinidiae TaxID=3064531 RepID=UPI0027D336A1|nr:hypothetical protein [Paracoccus sp. M09]